MAARQIVNLLRGSVRVRVTGGFPERFLNLCAQEGLSFWDMEQPGEQLLLLTVAWTDRRALDELAQRAGCTVSTGDRRGVPPFLLRFRKRYAFLVGLAVAVAAVCFLSRFVLVIEVEGNERIHTQVILSELQRQGLRPGVYGPGLDLRGMTNEVLRNVKELSWLTVNLYGIRAQVVVRETLEEPQLVDSSVRGDIVAKAPGIVTRIEAWEGDKAVSVGDTVLAGDVLIRGTVQMDKPLVGETLPPPLVVRPLGKVEGRTWRTLTASIPLESEVKRYTGEGRRDWSLTILGRRFNFSEKGGISYPRYDKISETWNLTLPGGTVLPIALRREVCRGYETDLARIDPDRARTMLEERLLVQLSELLGETGEEVSHSFTAWEGDGKLTVQLIAECREELGRFQADPASAPTP